LPDKPGQVYIELVTITGSPQEREATLCGKKAGQKVVKRWTKMGQKVVKRWSKAGQTRDFVANAKCKYQISNFRARANDYRLGFCDLFALAKRSIENHRLRRLSQMKRRGRFDVQMQSIFTNIVPYCDLFTEGKKEHRSVPRLRTNRNLSADYADFAIFLHQQKGAFKTTDFADDAD